MTLFTFSRRQITCISAVIDKFKVKKMDYRDLSSGNMGTSSQFSYYNSRNSNSYSEFDVVQDLSHSGQCMQMQTQPECTDNDNVSMDLSLLLSSPKDCDRQTIEDDLPLNLTGKAREDEINRRLRQWHQFNYSYPYSDPPRSSQVFVAPDFLGMHELQDLRTHISYNLEENPTLNLSYCSQTLDLSAQSLDLSLSGQDLSYADPNGGTLDLSCSQSLSLDNYSNCDVLNLTCTNATDNTTNSDVIDLRQIDFSLQDLQHSLPPASSLPLPLSITQTLPTTTCNSVQYAALDLQKNNSETSQLEKKTYTCAQCGENFASTEQLSAHREQHLQSKPFACQQCSVRFTRAAAMNRHVKSTHGNVRPFGCSSCGKTFSQKHDLQRHMHLHKAK